MYHSSVSYITPPPAIVSIYMWFWKVNNIHKPADNDNSINNSWSVGEFPLKRMLLDHLHKYKQIPLHDYELTLHSKVLIQSSEPHSEYIWKH